MGKIKTVFKALFCAAAVALTAAVPASGASATDYDSLIAEQDSIIAQLKKDNELRENQIFGFTGDIAENDAKIALISEQIDGVTAEISAYGELITLMECKISTKEAEIADLTEKISGKETEIADKQEKIVQLEAENKENLQKFAKLIRALYMNDASETLPILNSSDDWYDFFTYGEIVRDISSQNLDFMNRLLSSIKEHKEFIQELNNDIAQLNADKAELQDKKAELEADLAELSQKKADAQAIADEAYARLAEITADNEELSSRVTILRGEISDAEAQMEAANKDLEELIKRKQLEAQGGNIYSSDGFRWPLDRKYQQITTDFGYDPWRSGNHSGIDVGNYGIGGSNIYAVQGGTVILVKNGCTHNFGGSYKNCGCGGGYGNYVVIDHGGGLSTRYAHCSTVTVYEGQTVAKGDVIGYVGSTGWSTGYHLHFETRVYGTAVDPLKEYSYEFV